MILKVCGLRRHSPIRTGSEGKERLGLCPNFWSVTARNGFHIIPKSVAKRRIGLESGITGRIEVTFFWFDGVFFCRPMSWWLRSCFETVLLKFRDQKFWTNFRLLFSFLVCSEPAVERQRLSRTASKSGDRSTNPLTRCEKIHETSNAWNWLQIYLFLT